MATKEELVERQIAAATEVINEEKAGLKAAMKRLASALGIDEPKITIMFGMTELGAMIQILGVDPSVEASQFDKFEQEGQFDPNAPPTASLQYLDRKTSDKLQ